MDQQRKIVGEVMRLDWGRTDREEASVDGQRTCQDLKKRTTAPTKPLVDCKDNAVARQKQCLLIMLAVRLFFIRDTQAATPLSTPVWRPPAPPSHKSRAYGIYRAYGAPPYYPPVNL